MASEQRRFSPAEKVTAATAGLVLALGLTACGNVDAKPQPTQTSLSSEAPANPSTEPTGPDTTPTNPANGEFVSVPSGLKVDYDAFADWVNKKALESLEDSRQDFQYETSKRSVCNNFFVSNGLEINIEKTGWELDSNGENLQNNSEEFVRSMLARQDMALALARDDTDPRNLAVALNLIDCLTSPESKSRQYLMSQVEGIRDGSIQPQDLKLQSIDDYIAERNGDVTAVYTMVNAEGTPITTAQKWDARSSSSGLYRSTIYTPAAE